MDPTTTLLATVAWLIVAAALWRARGSNQLALLGLACLVAAAGYFGFGRFHGGGRFVHDHELYHHTLGSHYMAELGHYGLYGATCLALVENGKQPEELPELVTDLATYELESGAASLARGELFRASFSDERWADFRADVAFFDQRFGSEGWKKVLVDHGHNASPFWSAVGGTLVGWAGLSSGSLVGFGLLDLLLLVAMALALARAFDARVALVFATFYFANVFAPFGITGGAFLRHLWLAGVIGYVCCLRLGHLRLAGALLAVATLDRIFPAVLILWPLLEAVRAARAGGASEQADRGWQGAPPSSPWWGPHAQCVATFAVLVAVGVALTGPVAWVAFFQNVVAHGQGFYINQISLRSLFTVNPATATEIFSNDALWLRERVGLDAAWYLTLRAVRLSCVLLIGLALWRERDPLRGLALLAFVPFLLLYPADYYHLFLGIGLLDPSRTRRLVVGGMAGLFALSHWLHTSAGGSGVEAALAALSQVELFNWWVSLAITAAVLWLLFRSVPDRRAWIVAGAFVGLGLGGDLLRTRVVTSLDLIPADVAASDGCEVLLEGMHGWGNGWGRGDQVAVLSERLGDLATIDLAVPSAGRYRLRVDLTTTPVFGQVQVSVSSPGAGGMAPAGDALGTPLGEPLDLYSPRVGLVSLLLPEVELSAGVQRLAFTVIGKHPAASHHHFGLDRLGWEPVRELAHEPGLAAARARAWLAATPGTELALLPPEPARLSAPELEAKYRSEDPGTVLAGAVDLRQAPLVRAYLTDLALALGTPESGTEGQPPTADAALVQDGLRWALALADTTTVARLVPVARRLGLDDAQPGVATALAFLLDQQREDGSFGPAEPTSHRPRARTVHLALEALGSGE